MLSTSFVQCEALDVLLLLLIDSSEKRLQLWIQSMTSITSDSTPLHFLGGFIEWFQNWRFNTCCLDENDVGVVWYRIEMELTGVKNSALFLYSDGEMNKLTKVPAEAVSQGMLRWFTTYMLTR
ncbi:hypothetical protein Bca4012_062923 [Brassica carinata]